MKKIIVTVLILANLQLILGQTDIDNHKKYWYYRSRLVNDYVKVGCTSGSSGRGESLPFNQRARYANDILFKSSEMAMGDELSTLGIYIGVLATEYRLLWNSGQSTQKIKHELYCALNALNRLDYYAESSLFGSCSNSLNGFLMRDDMPVDFVFNNYKHFNYYNQWTGTTINNGTTPSTYQADRGFASLGQQGVFQSFSNYQDYVQNGNFDKTAVRMSQDHAISILFGLSLVNSLVDAQADDNGQDQYYDPGHVKLVDAARSIVNRIVSYIQKGGSHLWNIADPCTGIDIGNGAGGSALTYAYAMAETRGIATGKGTSLMGIPACQEPLCPLVPLAYPLYHDAYSVATGYVAWQGDAKNVGLTPDNAVQSAELSSSCNCIYSKNGGYSDTYTTYALTNTWKWLGFAFGWVTEIIQEVTYVYVPIEISNTTNDAMRTNVDSWHLEYAPFARRLIHGGSAQNIPPESINIKGLLDQAPCEGPWNLTHYFNSLPQPQYSSYEWSSDTRVEHPERRGFAPKGIDYFTGQPTYYDIVRGEYNGLDYMLFHNLWYLYRNTFNNTNHTIIDLSDRILDNNFTIPTVNQDVSSGLSISGSGSHASPATLGAFETIKAANTVLSTADVTYRAGKNIQFTNGFHVQSGAAFHAYVDPYSCSGFGSSGTYNRTTQTGSGSGDGYINSDMLPISTHHVKYDPSVMQYPLPQSNEVNITSLNKPTPDLKQAISNAIQKNAIEELSFNVSPNPSNGTFKVSVPVSEQFESCTVWVYDMQGKEVYSDILKRSNNMEIKLADALPGTYLVRAMTEKGAQYKSKIIIK